MSSGTERTLRVGILCRGDRLERWQAEALGAVMRESGVEVVLRIAEDPVTEPPRSSRRRSWSTALYRNYRRRWGPPAMQQVDMPEEVRQAPLLKVRVQHKGGREHFPQEALDRIARLRPDILLRFGFNILDGPILELPTHGVWSFHHGDPAQYRGGPPGFWEIMRGDPVIGAVLQRLTPALDGGRILRQGWFSTVPHSLADTVEHVLMHSAVWPSLVMRALLAGQADAAQGSTPAAKGRLYRYPGNLTFLRFLFRQFASKLRFHRMELTRHEAWNIGVLYQPIASLLEEKPSLNVRWLPDPADTSFRADPFGYVADDGHLNVLYEKYDRKNGLGSIARLRPKKDNVLKRSRTMLETGTHLSYPYVVQHEGQIYVIPETADSGRVQLFRVNDENTGLELVCPLLEEGLLDPTVVHHAGRWWMFGTKPPLTNVELYIYHAEDLRGPWTPHLLNPVKSDIHSARPGGTPFHHQGQLWRPAQDSSRTYGGRIALNRVLVLDPERFQEETVKYVGPLKGTAYNQGLHTLAAVGNITLVDGKRYIFARDQEKRIRRKKLAKLKRDKD